jgi:DNA invertase Pin-like site-specific DNA recombinase
MRANDGHEKTTTAAISEAKQDRQDKVRQLHSSGHDRDAIASALNIKPDKVRTDLREMGLIERKHNLDRTTAYALADGGMSWPAAAKQAGISHAHFCRWMKESGRTPPSAKNHLLRGQIKQLLQQGKTYAAIHAATGASTSTIAAVKKEML